MADSVQIKVDTAEAKENCQLYRKAYLIGA